MKNICLPVLILTSLVFSGCASVPMESKVEDEAAKTFEVVEDRSNIYIYRNENFGGAIKMPVVLDDKIVGDTAPKTFILKTVDPGEHVVVSKTENDASLAFTTEAGKNYFVWQEVKMGLWTARSKLHLVDEATGRDGVNECKLVK
jgi:uncharacterized protein YceK|tara:strand:+ start:1740 stop:2174 length:435 start_codon:yes stop_codon:yes gene_type:complete